MAKKDQQTTVHKTQHRKMKTEQHKPHQISNDFFVLFFYRLSFHRILFIFVKMKFNHFNLKLAPVKSNPVALYLFDKDKKTEITIPIIFSFKSITKVNSNTELIS